MTSSRPTIHPDRIEALEARIAPAGIVTIVINKADVMFVGDGADNDITLTESGIGSYFLTGNNGTTIALAGKPNGTFQGIDSIFGNLSVALGGGNDSFTLTSVNLPHNLTFTDLVGDNTVTLGSASIGGKLSMKFGPGHDVVQGAPTAFHVGGDLVFSGGNGFNDFEVQGTTFSVSGNFTLSGGANSDTLNLMPKTLSIGKNVSVQPGAGSAVIEFAPTSTLIIGGGVTMKGSLLPNANGLLNLRGPDLLSVGKGITYTGSASSDLLEFGGKDLEIHGAVSLTGGGDNKHIAVGATSGAILGPVTVSGTKESATLSANGGFTIAGKTTVTGGPGGAYVDLSGTLNLAGGLAISGVSTAAGADVFVNLVGTGSGITIGNAFSAKYLGAAGNPGTFTVQNVLLANIASIITGAGIDTVTIDQVESYGAFTLDTGGSGDTVNIERAQQTRFTHFLKPVVLKLGSGNDFLNIGSANANDGVGFLSPIASIFDGGLGVDTVVIDPANAFLKPAKLVGF